MRTLRIWKEADLPLNMERVNENKWNILYLAKCGDITLHLEAFKTKKFMGKDESSIEVEILHL